MVGATTTLNSATNGNIYTIAGSGTTGVYSYTAPVLSTGVSMTPQKLAMDASSNLYISDGNGFIWFLDFHTGYLRAIASNATVCSAKTDSYGDGCPATQASFGIGSQGGLGVGADSLGNIYISDTANLLIRKVITGLASPSTTTGGTTTQPVQLHFIAGDTLATANGLAYTSSEWTLGTANCTGNTDTTSDCLLTSSFTPAVPGGRSTPLTVNSSLGHNVARRHGSLNLHRGSRGWNHLPCGDSADTQRIARWSYLQLLAGHIDSGRRHNHSDSDGEHSADAGQRQASHSASRRRTCRKQQRWHGRRLGEQAGAVLTGARAAAVCRQAAPHEQTAGPHDVRADFAGCGHGRSSRDECLRHRDWLLRPSAADFHSDRNRNLGCLVALRHSHPHG